MFQGTIRKEMRAMFAALCDGWEATALYNPCAGNFTINQVIAATGIRLSHYACDVLLLSSAMGWRLAGQPVPIALRDEAARHAPWAAATMATDADRLATVLLLDGIKQYVGKESAYARRLLAGYAVQWPRLHQRTVEKIAGFRFRLDGFDAEDAMTWVERIPRDAAVASSPPYSTTPNGFASQYRKLDKLFAWPEPPYQPFTPEAIAALIHKLVDRRDFIVAFDVRLPELEAFHRGVVRWPMRRVTGHVYASSPKRRIVVPLTSTTPAGIEVLGPGEALGDEFRLVELTPNQFRQLRAVYYNPSLRGAPFDLAVGVVVGDKLVGAFAVRAGWRVSGVSREAVGQVAHPWLYGVNGFGVSGTDYPRLSQLPVYALLSHEFQAFAEAKLRSRLRSYVTEAFSDHPEVKRYRGTLRLLVRAENAFLEKHHGNAAYQVAVSYYRRPWHLWYGSELGRWSLAEGFARWRKKAGGPTK